MELKIEKQKAESLTLYTLAVKQGNRMKSMFEFNQIKNKKGSSQVICIHEIIS